MKIIFALLVTILLTGCSGNEMKPIDFKDKEDKPISISIIQNSEKIDKNKAFNLINDIYKLKKIAPENYGNLHKIFFLDWGQKNRIYTPSESTQLRLLLSYLIPSFQNKGSMMQTNIYSKLLNLFSHV